MLVLSRKINECLLIGENIVVMVTAIQGDKVRIGVTAPANVPIRRDELEARTPTHGENYGGGFTAQGRKQREQPDTKC